MGQVCWHGMVFGRIGLVVMRNGAQFWWGNLLKIRTEVCTLNRMCRGGEIEMEGEQGGIFVKEGIELKLFDEAGTNYC